MNILIGVPYLFCPEIENGTRNKSGFAYMIRSIAEELSKENNVYVFTQSYFPAKEEKIQNGLTIVRKRRIDVIKNINYDYIKLAISALKNESLPLKKSIRVLAYFVSGGYFEQLVDELNIEKVYIHGISYYTVPFLFACMRKKVKVAVTLHGLVSLDRNYVSVTNFEAKLEQEFIKYSSDNDVPISMISTGMLERMKRALRCNLENVTIICNFYGKDLEKLAKEERINSEYSRPQILCVGSVYALKNQLGVIKAFAQIKQRKNHPVLKIIGDGTDLNMIRRYVQENAIDDVIFMGRVDHEKLSDEYRNSSLVVMASICEGFGLPVIEGYLFGIPAIMYDDLDAFHDLFNSETMIAVNRNGMDSLTEAIEIALDTIWSKDKIKEFSHNFSSGDIGSKYLSWIKEDHQGIIKNNFFETIFTKCG